MNLSRSVLTNLFFICFAFNGLVRCSRSQAKRLLPRRDISFKNLASSYDSFLELVKPITVKRVSGTAENKQVKNVKKNISIIVV
jgi:hypothetical protein